MKFPFMPKIDARGGHRENLITYFLWIGIPIILAFAIIEWFNQEYDESVLDIVLLIILIVSAIRRNRTENRQPIYRIVIAAFTINFLYILFTNPVIVTGLFWLLALILPAMILLGFKEGLIWILAVWATIITYLFSRPEPPFASPQTSIIYIVAFITIGLMASFSEFVREQTARMLFSRQDDLESLNQRIKAESLKDPLTTLFNRNYLTEIMPEKVAHAIRHDLPLSIIIVDIDQFKEVNDTYGHLRGDSLLSLIARMFTRQLRSQSDDLVRLGGDEFMAVLSNTCLKDAANLAERLRQSVTEVDFPDEIPQITCSMGVVQLEEKERHLHPDHAIRSLIKRGDDCMYRAKDQGRNIVVSNCKSN